MLEDELNHILPALLMSVCSGTISLGNKSSILSILCSESSHCSWVLGNVSDNAVL